MSHLEKFSDAQRIALDLLSDTFRKHWGTLIENIHVPDPARFALDLHTAACVVIDSEEARLELARRTYCSLMSAGVPKSGSADESTMRKAYHDRNAQLRWAQEVIHWLGDFMGHLQDEATQSGTAH
ncbi:hypothetical protein [Paraburkholderia sp. CNPSo 3281]|uniref:hypothetical protein n=1 Tax=Paraburkholderia sp. CNPSo 3281 TaxID=2940933 RepID=UPI0020B85B13|nr:hypothetical protein [Paraburkholderia sp. CNPSo 3281]MCP3719122.1 hypothetical protein [Paraburkholderia sp. CNPSo 3281]